MSGEDTRWEIPSPGDLCVAFFAAIAEAACDHAPCGPIEGKQLLCLKQLHRAMTDANHLSSSRLADVACAFVVAVHRQHILAGVPRLLFLAAVLRQLCTDNGAVLDADTTELEFLGSADLVRVTGSERLATMLEPMIMDAGDKGDWIAPKQAPSPNEVVVLAAMNEVPERERQSVADDVLSIASSLQAAGYRSIYCPPLMERDDRRTDDEVADDHARRLPAARAVIALVHPGSIGVGISIGQLPNDVPLLILGFRGRSKPRLVRSARYRTYESSHDIVEHVKSFLAEQVDNPPEDQPSGFDAAARVLATAVRARRLSGEWTTPRGLTDSEVDHITTSAGWVHAQAWQLSAITDAVGLQITWGGLLGDRNETSAPPLHVSVPEEVASQIPPSPPERAEQLQLDLGLQASMEETQSLHQMEIDLADLIRRNGLIGPLLTDREVESARTASDGWPSGDLEWMLAWARLSRAEERALRMGRQQLSGRFRATPLNEPEDWAREWRSTRRRRRSS